MEAKTYTVRALLDETPAAFRQRMHALAMVLDDLGVEIRLRMREAPLRCDVLVVAASDVERRLLLGDSDGRTDMLG